MRMSPVINHVTRFTRAKQICVLWGSIRVSTFHWGRNSRPIRGKRNAVWYHRNYLDNEGVKKERRSLSLPLSLSLTLRIMYRRTILWSHCQIIDYNFYLILNVHYLTKLAPLFLERLLWNENTCPLIYYISVYIYISNYVNDTVY